MKKQYVTVEIEAVKLEVRDVIATSEPFDGEEQPFNKQGTPVF